MAAESGGWRLLLTGLAAAAFTLVVFILLSEPLLEEMAVS